MRHPNMIITAGMAVILTVASPAISTGKGDSTEGTGGEQVSAGGQLHLDKAVILKNYMYASILAGCLIGYALRYGSLPAKLSDLTRLPKNWPDTGQQPVLKHLPSARFKYHSPPQPLDILYPAKLGQRNRVVIGSSELGIKGVETPLGNYACTNIRGEIQDTGGWGYIHGKMDGRPYGVIFISCTHPCATTGDSEYPVYRMILSGTIRVEGKWEIIMPGGGAFQAVNTIPQPTPTELQKVFTDFANETGGDWVMQVGVQQVAALEGALEATTRGNLSSLRSAISIYYGDREGIYPRSLSTAPDSEFSIFLESVPAVKATHTGIGAGTVESPEGNQVLISTDERITTKGRGWRYNPNTGRVFVNSCATDSRGIPYSCYGY